MKKLLLFVAVTALSVGATQSQELRFGAKAGVNFASIGGDDTDGIGGRTSFHVGGLAEIPLFDKFAIQPELLYSSEGAQDKDTETYMGVTVEYKSTLKLDYINIPIMAKYYIIDGLAAEAGPQFGILVSAKAEDEISGGGDSESETYDVKDQFKTLDVGFGLGASYRLDFGLFFSARYIIGLSDITEDIEYDLGYGMTVVDDSKQKNNVFQLSVGYTF